MKSGKYLKQAALTLAAAALLTLPVLGADFIDASDIANGAAVDELVELGVLSGKPDGSFDPAGTLRRSEMAAMLSLLLEPDGGTYPSAGFADVAGTWAERYVDHCYSLGIVAGMEEGVFAPARAVTGTQAAQMILSAAEYDFQPGTGSGWAPAVNEAAKEAGLYEGFTADPALPLTRDGAALLLYNGLDLLRARRLALEFAPAGIAVQADGSLLLTDGTNRAVWQLRDGQLTRFDRGNALRGPWAIAPFLGGWAVSDPESGALRLLLDSGVQTINASGSGTALSRPTGLAAGDGTLYVADTDRGEIRRIDTDGRMTVAASGLNEPMGLCWAGGALYIAETGGNRILRLEDGVLTTVAGAGREGFEDGPAAQALFSAPQGVAVAEDGTVYVSDTVNSAVRRIRDGQVETVLARDLADLASQQAVSPTGLAVQGRRLYVCDSFSNTLLIVRI